MSHRRLSLEPAPLWALPLVVLLGVGVLILHNSQRINHDCALFLQCGMLLAEGKLPYVDFVEINPPLIMYLNAVPALLARELSIGPILSFSLCVLALAAWSTFAVHSQLLGAGTIPRSATATLAALWAGFSLLLWGLGEFGQREHLFLLFTIPYLMLRWRRCLGGTVRPATAVLLGLAAGIGICVKPQLALGVLAVEVYFALLGRTLGYLASVEVAALLCAVLAYTIHFLFLPQAVRYSFFHRWIPLVWEAYSAYNAPLASTLNRSVSGVLGVSLLGLGVRRFWSGPAGTLAGALAAFTLGSVAAYFLQHKGWHYHQIPALGAALLLLAVSAVAVLERLGTPGTLVRSAPVQVLLPLALGCSWLIVIGYAMNARFLDVGSPFWSHPFEPLISTYSRDGEPVLFVWTSVAPAYPLLVQDNRRPGSRYLWFFPIALFTHRRSLGNEARLGYPPPAALPPDESRFVADVAEDIATRRPPLIFVPTLGACQGCPAGFKVMDYLVAVGLVDKILQEHTRVADVSGNAVFVRTDRLGHGAGS